MILRCYIVFRKKCFFISKGYLGLFVYIESGKKVFGIVEKIFKNGLGREVNNV